MDVSSTLLSSTLSFTSLNCATGTADDFSAAVIDGRCSSRRFVMIEIEKISANKITPNLLPFSIEYEGDADISTYFHPVNNVAAFRGRKITAKDVKLGEGMVGVCAKEVISDAQPKQNKKAVKASKYSMDDEDIEDDNDMDAYDAQTKQYSDDDEKSQPQIQQDTRQTFQSTGHTFTEFKVWMPDDHVAESTHPLCRIDEQQKLFALVGGFVFSISAHAHTNQINATD